MSKPEYWTMFYYGSALTICDKCESKAQAERLARKCEGRGGATHLIAKVQWVSRVKWPKRSK